jgi:hypothetical protein
VGFRDDHDAALARITALEQALARERADDDSQRARIAALEAELRAARAELERAAAELDQLRPPADPPRAAEPSVPGAPPVPAEPRPAVGAVGQAWLWVIGVLAAFGALAVGITMCGEGREATAPVPPPRVAAMADDISGYLAEGRARAERLLPGSRIISMTGRGVDEHGRLHPDHGVLVLALPDQSEASDRRRSRPTDRRAAAGAAQVVAVRLSDPRAHRHRLDASAPARASDLGVRNR